MKRLGQSDSTYWDSLRLIASNVEFIVSDGPQPRPRGSGFVSLIADPIMPPAQRPRSMLAAALAGDTTPSLDVWETPILGSGMVQRKLHEAILEVLPGADQLGDSRQERIEALTKRLPALASYQRLNLDNNYRGAVNALKSAAKLLGGGFASDVAEFSLLRVLIGPLSMFELAKELPSIAAQPTRDEVRAALKAARVLEGFFSAYGGVHATGDVDLMATLRLHEVAASLARMARSHKAPQRESAPQILYVDALIAGMLREFGDCHAPTLSALAAIVDYRTDSSNLRARIKDHRLKVANPAS